MYHDGKIISYFFFFYGLLNIKKGLRIIYNSIIDLLYIYLLNYTELYCCNVANEKITEKKKKHIIQYSSIMYQYAFFQLQH